MTDVSKTNKELSQQSTMFNISSWAHGKVEKKRKARGLGELKPRQNNPYRQFVSYSASICAAKIIFNPLERLRILSQTRHMSNVSNDTRPTGSTFGNLNKIMSEQGPSALWRGTNANLYRSLLLIGLNVTVYDRIKHAYMPYDQSRYVGIDYYWRVFASSCMIMGVTAALTYPLDLIHTRLSSDMTKKGETRLFTTTFDCFNRTNIDEGFRKGLYKGYELCIASSVARSMLTLPIYDTMRSDSVKGTMESTGFTSNLYQKVGVSLFSSLIMSSILYPLDTAKRCMQLNGARGHFNTYKGPIDCFMGLLKTGGASCLYRGVHLFLIKEMLSAFA